MTSFSRLLSNGEKERLNANKHYKFILSVLTVFVKTLQNVGTVVEDNCVTNWAVSHLIGSNFIWCGSLQYIVGVQDVSRQIEDEIDSVKVIMRKLLFQIQAVRNCMLTPFKLKQSNGIRWSFTYTCCHVFWSFCRSY